MGVATHRVCGSQAAAGDGDDSIARARLPSPALADKHFIDLGRSLYVGASESDRACADAAGVCLEWAREFFRVGVGASVGWGEGAWSSRLAS